MKHLKVLGLAAVAALALTAFAGAGTASATFTSLCKVKQTKGPCEPKLINEYPMETLIVAEVEKGTELAVDVGFLGFNCKEGLIEAETVEQTEIPLHALLAELTFGGCGCAVFPKKKGEMDIELIDIPVLTNNGTLTLTETEVGLDCMGLECVYEPGHIGVLTGGEEATIDFKSTMVKRPGSDMGCANTMKIEGSYKVTKPKPLWVSE